MAALILGGLGLGVSQPGLTVMLINSVRPEDYGSAAGLQVMFTQIFSVLGLSVLGGVAAGRSTAGHAPSYVLAYLIGGAVAVIGVGLSLYLRVRVPDGSLAQRPDPVTADRPARPRPPGQVREVVM